MLLLSFHGCRSLRWGRSIDEIHHQLETGSARGKIKVLEDIKDDPAAGLRIALESVLAADRNHMVRALAAEALGNLGDPESVERIRFALRRDIQPIVRKYSLIALAKIRDEAVKEDVVRTVQIDDAPLVKITALDLAVAILDYKQKIQILQSAIDDEAEIVRLVAYNHLIELTGLDIPPDAPSLWQKELDQQDK